MNVRLVIFFENMNFDLDTRVNTFSRLFDSTRSIIDSFFLTIFTRLLLLANSTSCYKTKQLTIPSTWLHGSETISTKPVSKWASSRPYDFRHFGAATDLARAQESIIASLQRNVP